MGGREAFALEGIKYEKPSRMVRKRMERMMGSRCGPRLTCVLAACSGFLVAVLLSVVSSFVLLYRPAGSAALRRPDKLGSFFLAQQGYSSGDYFVLNDAKSMAVALDVPSDDELGDAATATAAEGGSSSRRASSGSSDLMARLRAWFRPPRPREDGDAGHVSRVLRDNSHERQHHFWDCMDAAIEPECRPDPAIRDNVLPFDEWLAHTKELIGATASFRGLKYEEFAPPKYNTSHYAGPWLEDDFIRYFLEEGRYEQFYPLVPLFVQWTGSLHGPDAGDKGAKHDQLLATVFGSSAPGGSGGGLLRPDVMYVTLMQYDRVPADKRLPCSTWRNVLIFSSAGWGNVPIPHLKGLVPVNFDTMWPPEQDPVHYYKRKFASTYVGDNTFGREHLWSLVAQPPSTLPAQWVIHLSHQMWRWMSNSVLFTLTPRGRDRATWKTYEVLQYGRVPLVLHTDVPWVPYQHTLDFAPPGSVPERLAEGGERDATQFGAVLQQQQEAGGAIAGLDDGSSGSSSSGPEFWNRLGSSSSSSSSSDAGALATGGGGGGGMWGPGGVGFAMSFSQLPSFWCVACEFIKEGSAAKWRGVRTLPLHRYGKGPGQECPCASADVWKEVAEREMGTRGNWTVPPTSLVYEMERRGNALVAKYFTQAAVIGHVEQFLQDPLASPLKCVPRPDTYTPAPK